MSATSMLVSPAVKRCPRMYSRRLPIAWLTVALTVCAAATACEDVRPVTPRVGDEHDALVYRWNALERRLEADNDARRHLQLAPGPSAELSGDLERAGSSLHDAHRSLEHMYSTLPEHARAERLEQARAALDEADAAMGQADAILARADSAPSAGESGAPTRDGAAPEG